MNIIYASVEMMEAKAGEERPDRVYCLVSLLPEQYRRLLSLHRSPQDLALLTLILALLTLNAGDLSEPELLALLASLEADTEAVGVEGRLQAWSRQRYLMTYRRKQAMDAEEVVMWAVGARAKVEMPVEGMLARFVGEMARVTEEPEAMQRHIAKAFEMAQKRPAPVQEQEYDDE